MIKIIISAITVANISYSNGKGGLIAHLGTNSGIDVENRIKEGDKHAELIWHAMGYNIAKEIGALAQ